MASADILVQPSGELWKKIRVELKEDVNTRDRDLAYIKEWLTKQPHLPDELEDQRIMSFLRGSSFSLEKCKRKIDMYYTMRAAVPELFTDRDVTRPELMEFLKCKAQGPTLPGLTPDGRRVTVARALDHNVDAYHLNYALKLALMIGDIRLLEEKEGVAGDVYVLDASVVSAAHLTKVSPTLIKKFLICVQEAFPVKLKEVHIVNPSPLIDAVISFVKPFLKEKIRKRIHTHTDLNELHKYIPKEMLPDEFGGIAGPIEIFHNAWLKKLEDYGEWFKKEELIKANEALRPGKPANYDEMFGIEGSFRTLQID